MCKFHAISACFFEDLPSNSDSFTSYDYTNENKTLVPSKDVEVAKENNSNDKL